VLAAEVERLELDVERLAVLFSRTKPRPTEAEARHGERVAPGSEEPCEQRGLRDQVPDAVHLVECLREVVAESCAEISLRLPRPELPASW
jgi:hypothetical protein